MYYVVTSERSELPMDIIRAAHEAAFEDRAEAQEYAEAHAEEHHYGLEVVSDRANVISYYVVGWVNGPISVRVEAEGAEEVQRRFDAGEFADASDECRTDAEDDFDIAGQDMTEAQFDDALRSAGLTPEQALDDAAQAGASGWYLWRE